MATTAPPPASSDPTPLPELTTYAASNQDDRLSALRLIADSIAQQRQTASRALIAHPLNLSLYVLCIALLAKMLYHSRSDAGLLFTTAAGLTMGALLLVRWLGQGYLDAAEAVGLDTVQAPGRSVLVTRFGDEVIGTAVWRWRDAETGAKGKGKDGKGRVAEVCAWAVRLRFRGKGVGGGLLDEVVRCVREAGGVGVDFDTEHANSKRVLPGIYNGVFDRKEQRARVALKAAWDAQAGGDGVGKAGKQGNGRR